MMEQYEEEFIDHCYDEMMNFSGLDTGFIQEILSAAEEDDNAYLIVLRWFKSENVNERKLFESMMAEYLIVGSFK